MPILHPLFHPLRQKWAGLDANTAGMHWLLPLLRPLNTEDAQRIAVMMSAWPLAL